MDRLSSYFTSEYTFFWLGAVFILVSLGSVYFGVCPGRGGCTYRSKEPKSFWFGVIIWFVCGVLFWIRFLNRFN